MLKTKNITFFFQGVANVFFLFSEVGMLGIYPEIGTEKKPNSFAKLRLVSPFLAQPITCAEIHEFMYISLTFLGARDAKLVTGRFSSFAPLKQRPAPETFVEWNNPPI